MDNTGISDKTEFVCPDCDASHSHIEWINDTFEYGVGEKQVLLKAHLPITVCDNCGAEFLGEKGAELRHDAVCKHLNLLTPHEIKLMRASLCLSQSSLAELSGVGTASISRWESGMNLQTRANDNLMRLLSIGNNAQLLKQHMNGQKMALGSSLNAKEFIGNALKKEADIAKVRESASSFNLRRTG